MDDPTYSLFNLEGNLSGKKEKRNKWIKVCKCPHSPGEVIPTDNPNLSCQRCPKCGKITILFERRRKAMDNNRQTLIPGLKPPKKMITRKEFMTVRDWILLNKEQAPFILEDLMATFTEKLGKDVAKSTVKDACRQADVTYKGQHGIDKITSLHSYLPCPFCHRQIKITAIK